MPLAFVRLAGALTLACAVSTAAASDSRRPVPGPIRAHLLRVLDGDTIEVLARVWPDHYIETRVRLDGIDTPELKGRCARERELAERAKARLTAILAPGHVQLVDFHYGKYAGRVVARVLTADGRDAARILIEERHARPYRSGRRAGWCSPANL